jgi:hypothetical protein
VCRSIKTLRPPYTDDVTPEDVDAAALQYVRKIAGMRHPSARNQPAFDAAVAAVTAATATLLADVVVGNRRPTEAGVARTRRRTRPCSPAVSRC